jgi:hypothetical protein
METLVLLATGLFTLAVWVLLVWILTPTARWLIDRLTR